MKNTLSFYKLKTDGAPTIGTYEGKEHLVIPVVMMVEGVHHGSAGAIYHSIEELGRFPGAWDGIPVVVRHPQDEEGNYVSANSPEILAEYKVGRIFHTHVDGKKLKSEAWVLQSKLSSVSPMANEKVTNNEIMEVSVGVYTENEQVEGEYADEKYTAIARNHRPDHLALLPDEKGACSTEDGCGLGVNSQTKPEMTEASAVKFLRKLAFFAVNKQGYTVIMDSLRRLLNTMDNDASYHWIEEIYDEYFIYVKETREAGSKMYKQGYSTVDNAVELVGEPIEVTKKIEVTYNELLSANGSKRTKFNINSKNDQDMDKNCKNCEEKVSAIILNSGNAFTESDRDFLMGLNADQLEKFLPKEGQAPQANGSTDPLQALSAEQKAWLELGQKTAKEKREKLTKSIQGNSSKELWPDDVLAGMEETMLQRVYDSLEAAKKVEAHTEEDETDYSVSGMETALGLNTKGDDGLEPLYPTGIEFKK